MRFNPRRRRARREAAKQAAQVQAPVTLPEDYRELQKMAKERGISANQSKKELLAALSK